ncbi:MAG: DNA-3-methyladenine glycosylase [Acidimicrobiia bacterium]
MAQSATEVAPRLLGCVFSTRIDGRLTAVELTEVEAYMGVDDPASHAYRGETARTAPMFARGGLIYVYLSYGVHHCVNVVTGPQGAAQAVLLRGGTPVEGREIMEHRRGRSQHLADGPGKLGQALGLTTRHSGLPIDNARIGLAPGKAPTRVLATPRVGISRAKDRLWRFVAQPGPDHA